MNTNQKIFQAETNDSPQSFVSFVWVLEVEPLWRHRVRSFGIWFSSRHKKIDILYPYSTCICILRGIPLFLLNA